ncbi:hypothetical protein GLYMA_19G157400v4 [Glycine max]|uniref:Uncharacterized protein n=1 Tax=Glycine max TaxID=3847 RepID=K7MYL1_SOYBN|nr:hypothetical protein JHK85_054545 [Glycine max]KAH1078010.1 hypothetical protein GYH30_053188 [Glycine max]KRG95547.1 hypothetical protein GLYMA_19G157400v4 [Glycine max]
MPQDGCQYGSWIFQLSFCPSLCFEVLHFVFNLGGQLEISCNFLKVGLCFHICRNVNILLLHPTSSPPKKRLFSLGINP